MPSGDGPITTNLAHYFEVRMHYCHNCHRMTPGEALFCSHCGRTYRVKLCPRLHVNPREALVCSQCGSQELSVPQPRLPFGKSVLYWMLGSLPRLLLISVVVLFIFSFVRALTNPEVLSGLLLLIIVFGLAAYIYGSLPRVVRRVIGAAIGKASGHQRNGHQGH